MARSSSTRVGPAHEAPDLERRTAPFGVAREDDRCEGQDHLHAVSRRQILDALGEAQPGPALAYRGPLLDRVAPRGRIIPVAGADLANRGAAFCPLVAAVGVVCPAVEEHQGLWGRQTGVQARQLESSRVAPRL